MANSSGHHFHIPVLGIGYSVDTPLKVAKYGISSVLSIVDDSLLETMRRHYYQLYNKEYVPITKSEEDSRAKRITSFLDMIWHIVKEQIETVKRSGFSEGSEISKYLDMLPEFSVLKTKYREMLASKDENIISKLQQWLREKITPGSIDVNVMTKLDRTNYASNGNELPVEFNDAHAAVRGFAKSELEGSIIFSAGMNPRLFSYMETLPEFSPDNNNSFKKKITIKVSDFRSAMIQGKFLANKGLWISEFRIESGLNCGGHAFASDGLLLGPILEEFVSRKQELITFLRDLYIKSLQKKNIKINSDKLQIDITVQGGVGKFSEQEFLMRYFNVNSVGWGSPFLLVPEVMNVDKITLEKLSKAGVKDIYLSNASPLGVPFNNLRHSTKEIERLKRIECGKFGSPCTKKALEFSKEFSERPICTASIKFQTNKVKQLKEKNLSPEEYKRDFEKIVAKECICEGLTSSVLAVNGIENKKTSDAASVCPGPNLAYFSKIVSLREMVDHIYGRIDLITDLHRPNLFIKELSLNIDYYYKLIRENIKPISEQTEKLLGKFKKNLIDGINYYKKIIPEIREETEKTRKKMNEELTALENRLISGISETV
ncbi:MAG: hypothetical protein Q8933_18705 [Bacteroidota bacterium]|nr:hypothetical protein [Bacteroidota bacterium]